MNLMKSLKCYIMIFIVSLLATLAVGFILLNADSANCSWCPTYKCFGANSCGFNCVCITGPGSVGGNCYSIE